MSARYTGDGNTTGRYYESGTYGNATGGIVWLGDVQSFEPTDDVHEVGYHFHGNTSRNVAGFVSTGQTFSGKTIFYPTDWKSLVFALGSCADTSGTVSTHVIKELDGGSVCQWTSGADCPFPSYQLYHGQKGAATGLNFVRQYAGVNTKLWKLTIPQANILSVEEDWVAQSVTASSGALVAVTSPGIRPLVSTDVKLFLPSGTIVQFVNTADFTIKNNTIAKQYGNGSVGVGTPIQGWREYMLNTGIDASSDWSQTLIQQYLLGGSQFNSLLAVTASGNRTMSITMSGCQLMTLSAPGALAAVNEQKLGIQPTSVVVSVSDTNPLYGAF